MTMLTSDKLARLERMAKHDIRERKKQTIMRVVYFNSEESAEAILALVQRVRVQGADETVGRLIREALEVVPPQRREQFISTYAHAFHTQACVAGEVPRDVLEAGEDCGCHRWARVDAIEAAIRAALKTAEGDNDGQSE